MKIQATVTFDVIDMTTTDMWDILKDKKGKQYILPMSTELMRKGKEIMVDHRLYLKKDFIGSAPPEKGGYPVYRLPLYVRDATIVERVDEE